jgi:ribosomal protein L37AE/L43A
MHKQRQVFEVNGVRVSLVRNGAAEIWQCDLCKTVCEHIVMAATQVRGRRVGPSTTESKLQH